MAPRFRLTSLIDPEQSFVFDTFPASETKRYLITVEVSDCTQAEGRTRMESARDVVKDFLGPQSKVLVVPMYNGKVTMGIYALDQIEDELTTLELSISASRKM